MKDSLLSRFSFAFLVTSDIVGGEQSLWELLTGPAKVFALNNCRMTC
jgi:hypothetical protein